MQENYLISITGKQRVDDETGEINLTTFGSYIKKGKNRFIVYKEYDEDSKNSRTSILKIEGKNKVTLMRGGPEQTHLVLEEGKRHLCQYSTGFGSMMIGIFTSNVRSSLGENGGDLEVNYTLDINSDLSSLNQILITVKEAENSDVETGTQSN